MKTHLRHLVVLLCLIQLFSVQNLSQTAEERKALVFITPDLIRSHIAFLSDDLLEGRGTGTRGDRLAEMYIATQFALLGLQPGAADGSYLQKVPIVGLEVNPGMVLWARAGAKTERFKYYDEFVTFSDVREPTVAVTNAEVVFVGYGIVAPEQRWDDFKNVNVKGKILLMMNDEPKSDDPKVFGGKARTYYGRWDYKYEIAAKRGATGAIIIHTTESAGYPWKVVQSSWSGEQFSLADVREPQLKISGWMTEDATRRLVSLSGKDLDVLRKSAESRKFSPVPLGVTLSDTIANTIRHLETANVLGLLRGSDPEKQQEVVVYTAHHDHLGIGTPLKGDSIYNGARDNASGVSLVLAIATSFAEGAPRPKRSVLFAAVGGEEAGLLGSEYYVTHPTFPLSSIVADINIDEANIYGPTRDIQMIGKGRSTLDVVVEGVAKELGMVVVPDQAPEQGYFYRSDQFSFAKVGVPVAYFDAGVDVIGKPPGWGEEQHKKFNAEDYHQPSDEIKQWWDYRGAVQQADFTFMLGYRLANAAKIPQWNRGDEFEAARKKSLEGVD
jgi:Zn-dependent M28 family amino/carboxypeptidase